MATEIDELIDEINTYSNRYEIQHFDKGHEDFAIKIASDIEFGKEIRDKISQLKPDVFESKDFAVLVKKIKELDDNESLQLSEELNIPLPFSYIDESDLEFSCDDSRFSILGFLQHRIPSKNSNTQFVRKVTKITEAKSKP